MSYQFDSASFEYLEYAFSAVTAAPCTIACWFKVPDITGDHALVQLHDQSVGAQRFGLIAKGATNDKLRIQIADGSRTDVDSSGTYSANTWHHGCAVFASTTSRYSYLDGTAGTENTTSVTPTGIDEFSIGAFRDSTPEYGDAIIAEVGIWNVALTSNEIADLAGGKPPSEVRTDNLIYHAPLRSDSDDKVGGLTATVGGTPVLLMNDNPPVTYKFTGGAVFRNGFTTYSKR